MHSTAGPVWTSTLPIPASELIPYYTSHYSVACNTAGPLVAWSEASRTIKVARFGNDGTLTDPQGIVVAGGNVSVPGAASNGTDYLVAWWDVHTTPSGPADGIRAARVSASGSVLDTVPILLWEQVPSALGVPIRGPVQVLFDGIDYIVAGYIRVTQAGAFTEQTSFCFPGSPSAYDGAEFLNVTPTGGSACLVAPNGGPLPPGLITVSQHDNQLASVAYGAGVFLVAWGTWTGASPQCPNLEAARVDTSGSVLDTAALALASCSNLAAAAFDGTNFVVFFSSL
jgi:hypothetical protein